MPFKRSTCSAQFCEKNINKKLEKSTQRNLFFGAIDLHNKEFNFFPGQASVQKFQ